MQPVLRCQLCHKPFEKESTLKRHGYYCRSRKRGPTTRARSCISCAESKARCDNTQPRCTRCVTKSITCRYPALRRKGSAGISHTESQLSSTPTHQWNTETIKDATTRNNDEIVTSPTPASETDWGSPNLDLGLIIAGEMDDFLAQFTAETPAESLLSQEMPALNVRSLMPRTKGDASAEATANLLFHNLQSYPLMILRQSSIPPFIHPSLLSLTSMESLHICINLMHVISNGLPGSRKLFWRNVKLECERICEEYLTLDKWERLAAMQALAIYLLVRLYEGETEHNNFEPLLLKAITLLAKQANSDEYTAEQKDLQASWSEWIYEESIRRICVVYQVVNMLVYFEPAMLCDLETDLILAPLPSKKRLWEATNENAWAAEREKEVQLVFGLATKGQLVNLADGAVSCSEARRSYTGSRRKADWGEWCSDMDGLGGLVMLAASLQS